MPISEMFDVLATDVSVLCFSGSIVLFIFALLLLVAATRWSDTVITFVMGAFWLLFLGSTASSVAVLRERADARATAILVVNAAFLLVSVAPRLRPRPRYRWPKEENGRWHSPRNGSDAETAARPEAKSNKKCRLELVKSNPSDFEVHDIPDGKRYSLAAQGHSAYWPWVFCVANRYEWRFELEVIQRDDVVKATAISKGFYWPFYSPFETGTPRNASATVTGSVSCLLSENGKCVPIVTDGETPGQAVEFWAFAKISADNSGKAGAVMRVQVIATFSGQRVIRKLNVGVKLPGGTELTGPEISLPDNTKEQLNRTIGFLYNCLDA